MAKRTLDELEAFLDWEEKIVWSPPGVLFLGNDDVAYALKITAKMAAECWGWSFQDIVEGLAYADEYIIKTGDPEGGDFDLDMLIQGYEEDWDLERFNKEIYPA